MRRIPVIIVVAAAAALTLGACGSSDSGSSGSGSSQTGSSASSTDFNDADVNFAQSMIPHHQQAVQMAKMAKTRAASPEVKQLAADIEAAQGPEIQTMQDWLTAWGQDSSSTDMGNMDMGSMPGMMSDGDMQMLEQMDGGKAWDRMFLEMMIRHHEGAIEMAKSEQADGQNPDAVALAQKVQTAQQAEITKIRGMLG